MKITFFVLVLILSLKVFSQVTDASDPFQGYQLPINMGIIEFENDNSQDFTKAIYYGTVSSPDIKTRFNIYPFSAFVDLKDVLKIREFRPLTEKLFTSLRTGMSIGFIITGKVIDSTDIILQLIRTLDGNYVYEKSIKGKSRSEIILQVVQLLLTGETKISQGNKMVLVEGGKYKMGFFLSDPAKVDELRIDKDELPATEVSVNDFWIDQYEVTVGEYRAFCKATNKELPEAPAWSWKDSDPIVNITWHQANEFAKWSGKRLPTEIEWEYAARGGKLTKTCDYSGSNNFNDIAWFYPNSNGTAQQVGTKLPNELGIFDMSGNVWEWCNDFYELYEARGQQDSIVSDINKSKVIRGGSFSDDLKCLKITNRSRFFSYNYSDNIGFRCVKNADK